MKSIKINNKTISIEDHFNLAEVLESLGYVGSHFAVAINQEFIPRTDYAHALSAGDVLEIVKPMQGG